MTSQTYRIISPEYADTSEPMTGAEFIEMCLQVFDIDHSCDDLDSPTDSDGNPVLEAI